MKRICGTFNYDNEFFAGKLPEQTQYLPDDSRDFPFFVERGLLGPDVCADLVAKITGTGPAGDAGTGIGTRKSKQFALSPDVEAIYREAFSLVRPKIDAFFNSTILSSEVAHALGYEAGGRYDKHSDNCDPVLDANDRVVRFKYTLPKRQISSLLFLCDSVLDIAAPLQCIGGNVSFPFIFDEMNEILILEPKMGMFVAFPSNPVYAHEVHEVIEGFRMVIVDWHDAIFHEPYRRA